MAATWRLRDTWSNVPTQGHSGSGRPRRDQKRGEVSSGTQRRSLWPSRRVWKPCGEPRACGRPCSGVPAGRNRPLSPPGAGPRPPAPGLPSAASDPDTGSSLRPATHAEHERRLREGDSGTAATGKLTTHVAGDSVPGQGRRRRCLSGTLDVLQSFGQVTPFLGVRSDWTPGGTRTSVPYAVFRTSRSSRRKRVLSEKGHRSRESRTEGCGPRGAA